MNVFAGMADHFVAAFGREAQYFAPGSDVGVDCVIIVTSAEDDKPELSGKPPIGGYRVAVRQSEVPAPAGTGRFVEAAPRTGTYAIVGKPTIDVENPDLWICKAG
ncbi:hypothetical protein JQ574_22805 [Bradyrhizobium sp. AUGA SZCCT0158]|uniref:hypothetical protein n=1 Tax=Bradyrhizobium sp. AUGA SZCCT0158 TaxID=2807661 RepID=UPI001BA8F3D5|nr:hypothetical protein [Bradyrhizobium sp. AUGA SZCCT0158]MBR1198831.1 hypothetical protein [Bradyrhizobium sp. AUGA SZCCT0158]